MRSWKPKMSDKLLLPVPKKQTQLWASVNDLESVRGGRDGLLGALTLTPIAGPQTKLLELLASPDHVHDSLSTLCRLSGVTPWQILELLREGDMVRLMTHAKMTALECSPDVIADVAAKAVDGVIPCPCTLTPTGTKPASMKCLGCSGTGYQHRTGSLEHAELLLKTAGLEPKKEPVVQNTQTTNIAAKFAGFDSFVNMPDRMDAVAPAAVTIVEVIDADTK
jgi:hypothetical protein